LGIKLYKRPRLDNPIMVASWPGIGSIGLIVVEMLRNMLDAEEIGEIEPWDFFYPRKLFIKDDVLQRLEFPGSKFYVKRTEKRDLLIFVGEEQPSSSGRAYAEGTRAYQMANLVIDLALDFGCSRLYTSGAAVAAVHHSQKPKVWAVPNSEDLLKEVKVLKNTVLMSDIDDRSGQGNIAGLNGLLLGVARKRGLDAICVMGEVPVYLQGLSLLYPKASLSVLETLKDALDLDIDLSEISSLAERSEDEIDMLYQKLPSEVRIPLDKLKDSALQSTKNNEKITEEDKQKILDDIDTFFKREKREDEN
jgi:proteasome assembly chaperone (PAC2) family protein